MGQKISGLMVAIKTYNLMSAGRRLQPAIVRLVSVRYWEEQTLALK
jgi:hypothetical protein